MVDCLRIRLLGPFELWVDGQMLAPGAWPGRKARQLFKILVTYRERMVASDELMEWLWPDLTPESARNSLWVAVSRLRRLLEPGATGRGASSFIITEDSGYRFYARSCCEIDVDLFFDQVRQGRSCQREESWAEAIEAFEAAGALYRGDYLAEDPYEDWAFPTRELLRETFLELEGALATCYLTLGHYQDALAHAREVLGHDPCRESAWRLVMEGHYRAGEQDQALRAFDRCRNVLAHELGVDPLPETSALHERMLRAPSSLPRQSSPPLPAALALQLPFVGRDHEWTRLADLLRRAMEGQGRVVLVSGEPGIGKTRLLDELAGLGAARGAQILAGQCYELEQNVAYAPILEALRGLLPVLFATPPACPAGQLAAVAELLPELRGIGLDLPPYRPLPPDEERARLLTSLAQMIRRCAQREPMVLLIDDLQWADASTLQLVHYLGRQVVNQPLLLAGAYRSTHIEPGHPLVALRDQLSRLGALEELSLPALKEEDVILLLRVLGSQDAGNALARQLYGKTEGHPYFLAEVLRTLAQEKWIVPDADGIWHLVEEAQTNLDEQSPLPPSVRAAATFRLDRLPPDERLLLDFASIIGREFSLLLMNRLLDWPEGALGAQATRLVTQGFLRLRGGDRSPEGVGDRYEFGHELMRRTVYDALSEPYRRLLHRQVAEVLRTNQAPVETVATHYAASDRPWLALENALAAAESAAHVVAYDEALAWCQKAMEIAETYPHAVPAGFRTRLHLQWRTLWYYRGDLERSLAADRAALAAARREGDTTAELQALWTLAHDETQVAAGGPSGLQAEALALARSLGDPAALAHSLARQGSDTGFLATPTGRQGALDMLDQAVRLARQVGDPALLHHILCEMWGVGRLPEARAALEEALVLVRQLEDRKEEVGTLAKLADLLVRQGDFAAAAAHARQGLALAAEVDSPAYGAWNRRALGQALTALGQTAEGLRHLQVAVRTFEAQGWQAMLAGTLLRLGLALQSAGDRMGAVGALGRVVALSRETREVYEAAYALAVLGELRLAQGEVSAGRKALEEATDLVPNIGLPWHRSGTLLHVAAGHLLRQEAEAARDAAREVICLAEEEDLREARAYGLWLHGRALHAMGRPDEAREALAAGLAQAEAIGQASLQDRLDAERTGHSQAQKRSVVA